MDNIDHKINDIINALPLKDNILSNIVYIKGAFSDFIYDIDINKLANKIENSKPTKGNGEVWYLDDEHHSEGGVSDRAFYSKVNLPLPEWAQKFQKTILEKLYYPKCHGWSAVIFWAKSKNSSVGEHVDNEDVYTVQLYGEKQWIIDLPCLKRLGDLVSNKSLARLNPSESWVRNKIEPISFQEPIKIIMRPGDFLAMPAFALHEVTTISDGKNLSFNASICQEQIWVNYSKENSDLIDLNTEKV